MLIKNNNIKEEKRKTKDNIEIFDTIIPTINSRRKIQKEEKEESKNKESKKIKEEENKKIKL